MATSGTYAFNPSLGALTQHAFNMCGVRPTALLHEHMESARMAANMLLGRWSAMGVNLWQVELVTIPLTQSPTILTSVCDGATLTVTYATPNTPIYTIGSSISLSGTTSFDGVYTVLNSGPGFLAVANATAGSTTGGTVSSTYPAATYSMNPNIVVILDCYIRVTSGSSYTDRYILPISRSEYASFANKSQIGFPTTFWMDRLLSPTVTLWPSPDGNEASLNYYCVQQIQDSAYTNGQTVDIPYYFLEAFALGLASRLAVIWAPDRAVTLKALADEAYDIAARQNVETSNVYISPTLQPYWRA